MAIGYEAIEGERANARIEGVLIAKRAHEEATDRLIAVANSRIEDCNRTIRAQREEIAALKAQLNEAAKRRSMNSVLAASFRDTLDELVTNGQADKNDVKKVFMSNFASIKKGAIDDKSLTENDFSTSGLIGSMKRTIAFILKITK